MGCNDVEVVGAPSTAIHCMQRESRRLWVYGGAAAGRFAFGRGAPLVRAGGWGAGQVTPIANEPQQRLRLTHPIYDNAVAPRLTHWYDPRMTALDDLVALVRKHGWDTTQSALPHLYLMYEGEIPSHGFRRGDYRTSVAAAHHNDDVRRFSAGSYSGRLLRQFVHDDYTDSEATTFVLGNAGVECTVSQWEGCRRRCSDLRLAGFLADTGVERDGRIVWGATELGNAAYDAMRDTGWTAKR